MEYEVVIIGASTAGLIAAEKLAESGRRVVVFEQGQRLLSDLRTYIITQGILRVIPDLDQELVRNRIHTLSIRSGEQCAEIELTAPDLVIERSELIEHLYHRAVQAGAEVRFNCRFLGVDQNGIRVEIEGIEKILRPQALIGADGVKSRVRSQVDSGLIPVVPLLQAEADLPQDWDPLVTGVWFDPSLTSYFFWLIPDKKGKGVLGLIADPGTDVRRALNDFAEQQGYELANYQTGSAGLHSISIVNEFKVGDIRILFAGDSAGQVKVTTVGGTVTGLVGGISAAKAIINKNSLRLELKTVQRELDLHLFIRNLLEGMSEKDYQTLIRLINPSVEKFLSKHDRDQMKTHFWKLALLQPAFIPLGIKLLVRLIFS